MTSATAVICASGSFASSMISWATPGGLGKVNCAFRRTSIFLFNGRYRCAVESVLHPYRRKGAVLEGLPDGKRHQVVGEFT